MVYCDSKDVFEVKRSLKIGRLLKAKSISKTLLYCLHQMSSPTLVEGLGLSKNALAKNLSNIKYFRPCFLIFSLFPTKVVRGSRVLLKMVSLIERERTLLKRFRVKENSWWEWWYSVIFKS